MNTSDCSPDFFAKPTFQASVQQPVLKGSARRALAAFETGYRFSCSFFPIVSVTDDPSSSLRPASAKGTAVRGEGLNASELDHLLERNLLPRFDEETPAPRRTGGFSPEALELGVLLVIVGAVLAKLFIG